MMDNTRKDLRSISFVLEAVEDEYRKFNEYGRSFLGAVEAIRLARSLLDGN